MIIADFDIERIAVNEPKTDTPLVIDRNGVLAFAVVLECMQPIPRRHPEIVKPGRQIHVFQFPDSRSCNFGWKAFGLPIQEQVASAAIGERLDHGIMYRVT